MRPIVVSVGPLANASATNIRSASAGSAGALTLNGALVSTGTSTFTPVGQPRRLVPSGQAVLDTPRQILVTNAADETGKTIVLTGLDRAGNTISETLTLATAGTVASVLSYAVLQSAVLSANSAGNLSIGTNGVADSGWVRLDDWAFAPIALQCDVTGTVNYTVQSTMDDPNDPTNPVAAASMAWIPSSDSAVVSATASKASTFTGVPRYVRCLLNSGTGSVSMTVSQPANAPL